MIQNAIKIDLPKGHAKEGGSEQQELVVSIDRDEKLYFNNSTISLEQLPEAVKKQLASMPGKQERRVWVKIDRSKSCSANILISTIDRIKVLGGVKDVAIATEAVQAA
jgi:biopolymer transport protein ExbD